MIEDLKDRSRGQVEVGETEITKIAGDKGLHGRGAAAVEKEDFVAGEDVGGPQLSLADCGGLNLRNETRDGGKTDAPA